MSKAFTVEDAPQGAARCPACGRGGQRVEPVTVEALVPRDARAGLGSDPFFCRTPGCAAAYFDSLGRTVGAGAVRGLGFPKRTDPDAVVCYCFGLRVRDVATASLSEVRARLDRGEGRCERANPAGRRCVSDLVRLARPPAAR